MMNEVSDDFYKFIFISFCHLDEDNNKLLD